MMPMSELLKRSNLAGTAGPIKEELITKIRTRVDELVSQESEAALDPTEMTTSQLANVVSVGDMVTCQKFH